MLNVETNVMTLTDAYLCFFLIQWMTGIIDNESVSNKKKI